jgi:hypothetical protein
MNPAAATGSAQAEALLMLVSIGHSYLVAARQPTSRRRFALDATPPGCDIGEGTVLTIAVQDEAGKVDLNIASPPLLRALVVGLGFSDGEAAVDAILDYRDEDDDRRVSGAERNEYLAAGRPYGPRNGPFLAVEELVDVLGISQANAGLLRPFVTMHSGLAAIDINVATQVMLDVLARGIQEGGGPSLLESGFSASGLSTMESRSGLLPPQFLAASTTRLFRALTGTHGARPRRSCAKPSSVPGAQRFGVSAAPLASWVGCHGRHPCHCGLVVLLIRFLLSAFPRSTGSP